MPKRIIIFILPVILLSACSFEPPLKQLSSLPLPPDTVAYEGEFETFLDTTISNLDSTWGNKRTQTDIRYYYLAPDTEINSIETLEKEYAQIFANYELRFEKVKDPTSQKIIYKHRATTGIQTFTASRVPLPDGQGAILLLSLFPVQK